MAVASRDNLIMTTADASLIRKLHAMRAARSVFEYEGRRWIISRIAQADEQSGSDQTMWWSVYGARARR